MKRKKNKKIPIPICRQNKIIAEQERVSVEAKEKRLTEAVAKRKQECRRYTAEDYINMVMNIASTPPMDGDSVAVMAYEHKTGGQITTMSKKALRRSRRKNYGTCLSTISPYRS
tara:strand:- start:1388 stop:1729 length:342 start_codon:yes stop_codon:yes gene_type:complete